MRITTNMDRRSFFKSIVGGFAATAAVRTFPFRVFSFPKEIILAPNPVSVRFVRCYDLVRARMVNRFDVLYGFGQLACPLAIDQAEVINIESGISDIAMEEFQEKCIKNYVAPFEGQVDGLVEHYQRRNERGEPEFVKSIAYPWHRDA